jgi:PST family polysaccharide transporter
MSLHLVDRGRGLMKNGIVRNAFGLYALQLGTYLLPIATVMVLARRLGPGSWGSLAFMQAFAAYVTYLTNYGFNYSATREVARNRDDPERLRELLAGVLGAKLALAGLAIVIVIPVSMLVPAIQREQALLWPGMLWAFSIAASPAWFFQGLERLGVVARCDTAARIVSLFAIVLVVHSPADTWKVLAIQGGLLFTAVAIEMAVAYRQVGFRRPTARLTWRTLRLGWSVFMLTGALSFYTIGNGFILGLFGPSVVVAYYMGAERICKVFGSMLTPISQAVYPRTSHLAVHARGEAARLARNSLFVMVGAALVMGAFLYLAAPLLVHVLLGPGFENAVVVLRILSILPPLIAASNVLGIQWGLALGLDRLVNLVMVGAGVLNVALAFVLVPHLYHVGMALSVVLSEAFVAAGLYLMLRLKHLDPISCSGAQWTQEPVAIPA